MDNNKTCKNCIFHIRGQCCVATTAGYMMEHGFKRCQDLKDWPTVSPEHTCKWFRSITPNLQMSLL